MVIPRQGKWGNSRWRGNCSGYIIRNLLEFYKPGFFVDPAMGSNTSGDVAKEMNIRYVGLDLHMGFNLLKCSLIERLGLEQADLIFFHPPYSGIIKYSGEVWGEAHPDDLSRCKDDSEFVEKLRIALLNIFEAVQTGGHYSVLIGGVRKNGQYRSFQSDVLQIAPGSLDGIIIKHQHACLSDTKTYAGSFIPIGHEYLLNFRKTATMIGLIDNAMATSNRLFALSKASWRSTVKWALQKLGGKAELQEIYGVIASGAQEKITSNPHWKEKVRQMLQETAVNVDRGVWALKAA